MMKYIYFFILGGRFFFFEFCFFFEFLIGEKEGSMIILVFDAFTLSLVGIFIFDIFDKFLDFVIILMFFHEFR